MDTVAPKQLSWKEACETWMRRLLCSPAGLLDSKMARSGRYPATPRSPSIATAGRAPPICASSCAVWLISPGMQNSYRADRPPALNTIVIAWTMRKRCRTSSTAWHCVRVRYETLASSDWRLASSEPRLATTKLPGPTLTWLWHSTRTSASHTDRPGKSTASD